jgi:hypothetical protein
MIDTRYTCCSHRCDHSICGQAAHDHLCTKTCLVCVVIARKRFERLTMCRQKSKTLTLTLDVPLPFAYGLPLPQPERLKLSHDAVIQVHSTQPGELRT